MVPYVSYFDISGALLPRHGQTRPGWRTGPKSATAKGPSNDFTEGNWLMIAERLRRKL